MKIALIQMNVIENKAQNLLTARAFLNEATKKGIDLAVLPEMFSCPYETDKFPIYAEEDGGDTWQFLSYTAKALGIYIVSGSVPEKDEQNHIYNTSYVFDRNGNQIAKHRKMHLFDIDIDGGQSFNESDTLTGGENVTVFDTEFGKMGLCVCYDIRFPELSRLMVDEGACAIFVPGAFNMTTGPMHWELLFRSRALDNQVFTIGVAPAYSENASYVSYGNSIAVSPWGEIIARLDKDISYAICDLDLSKVQKVRKELPLLAHRRKDIYSLSKINK